MKRVFHGLTSNTGATGDRFGDVQVRVLGGPAQSGEATSVDVLLPVFDSGVVVVTSAVFTMEPMTSGAIRTAMSTVRVLPAASRPGRVQVTSCPDRSARERVRVGVGVYPSKVNPSAVCRSLQRCLRQTDQGS